MDPIELKELIIGSSEIAKMRGGKKEATQEEQVTIDFAFATVVTIKALKKGDILSKENIWVKRPGTGDIKAESYKKLLGKKINKNIRNDIHLSWDDLDEY
jgi:N-acetylneuraminate synthase